MKKKLLDISGRIDPLNLEVLKKIKTAADKLDIDFFIVGATVRDMILHYFYDITIYRATNDVDFAVRVSNWGEYKHLVLEIESQGFEKSEKIIHRYTYKGLIIDFIPFGGISDKNDMVKWSDSEDEEMNVIGFEDAFIKSEDILIQKDPEIVIKGASVESLVMLKFFSWNDRSYSERLKDAKDLFLIITSYLRAGNEKRLYEEEYDIVESAVDYELSGARLLGRDIARSSSQKVRESILSILYDEKINILANEMAMYEGMSFDRDNNVNKCENLLLNLREGLLEIK